MICSSCGTLDDAGRKFCGGSGSRMAGLAALEGRQTDAVAAYREAPRAWRDLGLAWDEALSGMDMALLLDAADPQVAAAADGGREILVRLGAAPFIVRLDAAVARSASPA